MASQGRGSAVVAATVAVVCLLLVLNFEVAEAANYKVGDARGWTFKVDGWPAGKRFRAGDTVVFSYSPQAHNLVAVNKAGFDSCKPAASAKVYSSGNDQIKLRKGPNYFICSFVGHCESGMKVAITAM